MDRTRVGRVDFLRSCREAAIVLLALSSLGVLPEGARAAAAAVKTPGRAAKAATSKTATVKTAKTTRARIALPAGLQARVARREAARMGAPMNQLRTIDQAVTPVQNTEPMPELQPIEEATPAPLEQESVLPIPAMPHASLEPSCPCGDGSCLGCGECVSCAPPCNDCIPCVRYTAGFEATFVQPRFDGNVGLTVMEATGTTLETLSDREFDYDFDFAPRVFFGAGFEDGIGIRAMWWQFDHNANALRQQPQASGLGLVSPPAFGDVDISSNIATDVFTAASGLNAYSIDIEATKEGQFCAWRMGMAAGVRYGSADQTYLTELRNTGNTLRGRIDYRHRNEGFGPTLSLNSSLPLTPRVDLFGAGRGSLLFGQATSRLVAGEDLDLTTPLTTVKDTTRDDLLPTAELQLGLRWNGARWGSQAWRPYASLAMESQYWSGVGNATSEAGSLGFFGFAASGGVTW